MIKAVLLSLLLASPAEAQTTKPVPARADFFKSCLAWEGAANGFGSSVDKAFVMSTCECRFEHLPTTATMTKEQFFQSAVTCKNELARDQYAFIKKYWRH